MLSYYAQIRCVKCGDLCDVTTPILTPGIALKPSLQPVNITTTCRNINFGKSVQNSYVQGTSFLKVNDANQVIERF